MHQLKKTITALVLVFSMALSLMNFALATQTGTVTDDCVRIRTEPSSDSEVYQQANKGDTLTVLETADENGWVKVSFTYNETGDTMTGYVSADYIDIAGSSDSDEEAEEADSSASSDSSDSSSSDSDADTSTADSSDSSSSKSDSSSSSSSKSDSSASSSDSSADAEEEEVEETAAINSSISYTATVTDSGVRIRKKASTDSKILTTVPEGEIVTVLSTEDEEGWMKVRYYDTEGKKYTGYMSGEYLDINSIGSGVSKVVNTIIRESADSSSAITGLVPIGKSVDIYASENNWYKIEYQDMSGWVYCDCIRTEGEDDCVGYGTSTSEALHLREKASTNSTSLATMPKGTTFQITGTKKDGAWYAITYNGMSGYVSAEYVDVEDSCTSGYVQVIATSLSLRSGAGSSYARLTIVPQGELLEVIGTVDAWYEVSYGKFTGYVSGAFVSATTEDGFQAYPDYAKVTASVLTLREDASTESTALDSIPNGTIVAVSGISNGWYKVTYGGQTGYVDSGYLEDSDADAAAAQAAAAASAAAEAAAAAEESASESTTTTTTTTTTTSSSSSGSSVLSYASQFVGNPYVWGGTSLTNGCDCSGFVKSVFAHFGISLPHSSSAIRSYGKSVSYSDMQVGDVVCYSGHVGIYAGNGQLLSALGKKYGITYCSVNYKSIITIRRMTS